MPNARACVREKSGVPSGAVLVGEVGPSSTAFSDLLDVRPDGEFARNIFTGGGLTALPEGEESVVVNGVRKLWTVPYVAIEGGWLIALNTEDAVLVELAEPTPFNRSP